MLLDISWLLQHYFNLLMLLMFIWKVDILGVDISEVEIFGKLVFWELIKFGS